MQTVLITGGAGFIGSHSVRALLDRGWRVRVLDNLSTGKVDRLRADAHAAGRLDVIEADVRDAAAVNAAVQGCDAVLHLAAQVSVQWSIAEPVASAANNVTGFINVLEAVRAHRIARVVYASSAAVFGTPASLPVDEQAATAPLSPYGLEKVINEQYAALYRSLHGVSALGMRYFNVYGPAQDPHSPYAGVISKFAAALLEGRPLQVYGDGLQTRDFVYVEDVARANVQALESGVSGVVNVGQGHSITVRQLIDEMSRAFDRPATLNQRPAVLGDILHSATRIDLARDLLAWQPTTPLADGLAALAASLGT
ncbi:SDR family NAD(P)-dependent oxidoreductase [Caenimonas sedimenti]|uniref:SDR family NAD(P)-dependent oxidoreductase n=1 Tax=Caenimonas sedimenti TaxID=2596921 RepID=A0A562ZF45_9BURK|nr:SDR family NAD(P)-dependent oxidoreductase [Caenimonas sedimenti]TWO66154.1 SDR family NAD(P)-dependent oxidoreductase [Caenimonas sedimenti]